MIWQGNMLSPWTHFWHLSKFKTSFIVFMHQGLRNLSKGFRNSLVVNILQSLRKYFVELYFGWKRNNIWLQRKKRNIENSSGFFFAKSNGLGLWLSEVKGVKAFFHFDSLLFHLYHYERLFFATPANTFTRGHLSRDLSDYTIQKSLRCWKVYL